MCRFLSLDFECALKCPVDNEIHTVRFQAYPQVCDHVLDVVRCDLKPELEHFACGKACRALLESAEYWQQVYPESATFSGSD
jgi:hypothetical protein